MNLFLVMLALVAGMCLPVQAGINNYLKDWSGHTIPAACISFAVGTAVLVLYILAARIPLPALAEVGQTKLWHWSGGLLGAFFVSSAIFLAPRLGAATMLALIIAGQMTASLLLDHFGVLSYPVRELSLTRILGVALLIAGVLLIRKA